MNDSFFFLCSSFDSLYADYGHISGMDEFSLILFLSPVFGATRSGD